MWYFDESTSRLIGIIIALIYFVISRISYICEKRVIAPGVITPFIWGVLLLIYNSIETELYPLSLSLYAILSLWVIMFTMSANFFSRIKIADNIFKCNTLNNSVLSIYIVVVVLSIPLIFSRMLKMGGSDFSTFFVRLRLAQAGMIDEIDYGILRYSMTIAIILLLIAIYRKGTTKIGTYFLAIVNIFCVVATMAKTQFFWLIFPTATVLYFNSKLNVKIIFKGLLLCLCIFVTLQIARGGSSYYGLSVGSAFLQIYILGGLPAFDQIIKSNQHSEAFGYFTLSFFRKILGLSDEGDNVLMTIFNSSGMPGYAFVPFPTNVYTTLSAPYLDFGTYGIVIFGIIQGGLCGFFYKLATRRVIWGIIGYGYLFATICFQFYSDGIFLMLSQFIQFCIIPWFACYFSCQISIGKLSLKSWSHWIR